LATLLLQCHAQTAGWNWESNRGPGQARQYLLHLVRDQHVGWSRYNIARCGLQFFYQITMGKDNKFEASTIRQVWPHLSGVVTLLVAYSAYQGFINEIYNVQNEIMDVLQDRIYSARFKQYWVPASALHEAHELSRVPLVPSKI
jgi:hypothetical protein